MSGLISTVIPEPNGNIAKLPSINGHLATDAINLSDRYFPPKSRIPLDGRFKVESGSKPLPNSNSKSGDSILSALPLPNLNLNNDARSAADGYFQSSLTQPFAPSYVGRDNAKSFQTFEFLLIAGGLIFLLNKMR
nr:hypothetical protein 11 [bacterium]